MSVRQVRHSLDLVTAIAFRRSGREPDYSQHKSLRRKSFSRHAGAHRSDSGSRPELWEQTAFVYKNAARAFALTV